MAKVDSEKAFDRVPQTWIMNKISDKVIKFIKKAINKWKEAFSGKTHSRHCYLL